MSYSPDVTAAAVARGLSAADDPPRSCDDRKSAGAYVELGEHFRQGAWKHLHDDGDLPQASNKAWGMEAETVKAISVEHGGVIHTHRSIWLVVRELARVVRESGDTETASWINNSFARARSLYANFYEDEEFEDQVADGLQLCEQLSERLYELFWPERPTA